MPHPLRGGTKNIWQTDFEAIFQSTHPIRGATPTLFRFKFTDLISIHAPHAGCDPQKPYHFAFFKDFNPRTPCGVRPNGNTVKIKIFKFQSTHPMRGATPENQYFGFDFGFISIHAPHAGCDPGLV